jgi:hypothetical protein
MKEGDVYLHIYAGPVEVTDVGDDRYCTVNTVSLDFHTNKVERVMAKGMACAKSSLRPLERKPTNG